MNERIPRNVGDFTGVFFVSPAVLSAVLSNATLNESSTNVSPSPPSRGRAFIFTEGESAVDAMTN